MSNYAYSPPSSHHPHAATTSPAYGQSASSAPYHGLGRGGSSSAGRGCGRGGQHQRGRGAFPVAHPLTRNSPQDYAARQFASHPADPYAPHPPVVGYPPYQQPWSSQHGHPLASSHMAHHHASVPSAPTDYGTAYAQQSLAASQYHPVAYSTPQQYGHPYQVFPQPQIQPHSQANGTHWDHKAAPQQAHYLNAKPRGGFGHPGASKPPSVPVPQSWHHVPEASARGTYGPSYSQRPGGFPHPASPFPNPGSTLPNLAPSHLQHGRPTHQHRRGRGGVMHQDASRVQTGQHHTQAADRNHQTQPKQTSVAQLNSQRPKPTVLPSGRKKKRKTNTLGLTPGNDSESEDDAGEEKALVDLIGAETLNISDVAAYLAERRKNFPTKARVAAKRAAELARRDEEKATTELERRADELREQLRKVEVSIKRKREKGDEGDEMREILGESSDDEKPEVQPSRTEKHASASSPPNKKTDISRHCKYYSTGGTCGKKGKCRFVHDPEVRQAAIKEREANDGRMTIQQRLILNDKEQEDLTVLQSIQYLRERGMMAVTMKSEDTTSKDLAHEVENKATLEGEGGGGGSHK